MDELEDFVKEVSDSESSDVSLTNVRGISTPVAGAQNPVKGVKWSETGSHKSTPEGTFARSKDGDESPDKFIKHSNNIVKKYSGNHVKLLLTVFFNDVIRVLDELIR